MKVDIRLWIHDMEGDDPKKCSARKLLRTKMATRIDSIYRFPPRMILLHPYSDKAMSPADRTFAENKGIGIVDCSWVDAEKIFSKKMTYTRYECRSLPFVLAANPVNWGKPFKLSSLEAFSAALYITGHKEQAQNILGIYNWGNNFLELNREPLERYSRAKNSSEIITIQEDYIKG